MWWTTSTRSTTSSWTINRTKSGSSWNSHEKSHWDGRIETISRVHIRWIFEKKIDRRSRHYPWTHWQDTGTTEWNQLHERFERFSRCWISTQWTIPRSQSTCVFPTSSKFWRKAKPFCGNAEPQWWAADTHGISGNVFCKSNGVFFSTLSARDQSLDFQCVRTYITARNEWTPNTRHNFGSEMPVRTVSQKITPTLVREDL